MLAELRKGAGSWIARILLGLLIISFGVWGIGDFIRGTQDTDVAKVGSINISAAEFDQQYRRDLQVWQQRLGQAIDSPRARQLGLPEGTLQTMVQRALVDQEVEELKLHADDSTLVREIRENPAFRGATGQFDRFLFERILANNGYSESAYLVLFRRDFLRDQLLSAFDPAQVKVPSQLVDQLFAYRQEKRVAEVLAITPAMVGTIAEPDAATLQKFHQENAAAFTAPEYRRLSYVSLEPEALLGQIAVSDEEVREDFDARRQSFDVPERRDVQQIVFADEASAKTAVDKIRGGADFATVAKETRNLELADISLGKLARNQLPPPIAEAAFKLQPNAISDPVQSALGWHVLRVSAIEPGVSKSFEEMKPQLAREIGLQKAQDLLFQTANQLQDEVAGGASLEQAAEKLKLKIVSVPLVDKNGRTPSGEPAAGLPHFPNFLGVAFEGAVGADLQLTEAVDNTYFLVRVDETVPQALKPLESIRAEVLAAWRAQVADEKALEKAKEIADRIKEGGNFPALARSAGGEVRLTPAFTRTGQGADNSVPARLVAAMFQAKGGEVVAVSAGGGTGAMVARLHEIKPADATADAALRERMMRSLQSTIADDLASQYRAALEAEHGVRINRKVLDTVLN